MVNRQEHDEHFTMIDNVVLRNVNLSWEARGFFAFLLSLPDDWDFSIRGLVKVTGSSKSSIQRMLNELQDEGYVKMTWHKDESGHFTACTWDLFEGGNGHLPRRVPETRDTGITGHGENGTREKRDTGKTGHGYEADFDTKNPLKPTQTVHNTQKQTVVETDNRVLDLPYPVKTASRENGIPKIGTQQSTNNNKVLKEQSTKDKENIQKKFVPPTLEEVQAYCEERNNGIDPEAWYAYYKARGFKLGKGTPMKDWKAAVITWEKKAKDNQKAPGHCPPSTVNNEIDWDEVLRMAGGEE